MLLVTSSQEPVQVIVLHKILITFHQWSQKLLSLTFSKKLNPFSLSDEKRKEWKEGNEYKETYIKDEQSCCIRFEDVLLFDTSWYAVTMFLQENCLGKIGKRKIQGHTKKTNAETTAR